MSRSNSVEEAGENVNHYVRRRRLERSYDITLEAGEILFMPVGWWHQVKSSTFSVTITYTDFLWPNDAYATYPSALEAELMG